MSRDRDGDDGLRLLAARALGERLAALAREERPVRLAADCEPLHRMRVASRRLRAAAAAFAACWPRAWRPRWRRSLRRLTRALGRARDLDVQILWVESWLAGPVAPEARPGAERLLLRLRQRRERRQAGVTRALDRFAAEGAAAQLRALAEGETARLAARGTDVLTTAACAAARRAIARRLAALRAAGRALDRPADSAGHHAARIAAKRLRYTLELFLPLDEAGLRPGLKAARRLQEQLGELHDCDVWVERLPAFAARERRRTLRHFGQAEPFAALRPGLAALLEDRRRARPDLYAACVRTWRALATSATWDALAGLPADPGERPVPDAGAGPQADGHDGDAAPEAT